MRGFRAWIPPMCLDANEELPIGSLKRAMFELEIHFRLLLTSLFSFFLLVVGLSPSLSTPSAHSKILLLSPTSINLVFREVANLHCLSLGINCLSPFLLRRSFQMGGSDMSTEEKSRTTIWFCEVVQCRILVVRRLF